MDNGWPDISTPSPPHALARLWALVTLRCRVVGSRIIFRFPLLLFPSYCRAYITDVSFYFLFILQYDPLKSMGSRSSMDSDRSSFEGEKDSSGYTKQVSGDGQRESRDPVFGRDDGEGVGKIRPIRVAPVVSQVNSLATVGGTNKL